MSNDLKYTTRFPRTSQYHPDWILSAVSGGANPLWLTEWLVEAMELKSGMKVLDLGCGRAMSSIFLAREFGVQVWAADWWFDPAENRKRIDHAGLAKQVFPCRVDARHLPFAFEFFDAVIGIDSFHYFGTDFFYLPYLAQFLKPNGMLGIAAAGLVHEIETAAPPAHLAEWWEPGLWSLHSANWWRQHWNRSGVVDVEVADDLADGWEYWLRWQQVIAPDNAPEINALQADAGQNLTYVRAVAKRQREPIEPQIASIPENFQAFPLLSDSK
ncbi:MAG: methyltransferase domain-containing protein [Pirellulaceae bacterium]